MKLAKMNNLEMRKTRLATMIICTTLIFIIVIDVHKLPKKQLTSFIAIRIIKIYQKYISEKLPFIHCRYEISCSEYTMIQIREKGIYKGSLNGLKRVMSCY